MAFVIIESFAMVQDELVSDLKRGETRIITTPPDMLFQLAMHAMTPPH
jgi:hypothetical protein